ncbi:hypothetical protein BDR06DRAFT_198167 [Suillus hirtellus]|nr:hypothetical protein BDR06DRAFT_198167 [Suillus hirtellus]
MPHSKAESSTSAKQGEANRGALSGSSKLVASLKREKNPPAYGAQHRQDALWEGGNEALPPSWCEEHEDSEDIDEPPFYQDLLLGMGSSHRPLPGVRLGEQ